MLVYGDVERVQRAADMRRRIAEKLIAAGRCGANLHRHEMLVAAFIETGQLLQGLADQAFCRRGAEEVSECQQAGARLLHALAGTIVHSWQGEFSGALALRPDWPALLEHLDSADPVRTKLPEGYAFYALYPESYAEAAGRSGLSARTVVIGLRSIGVGLAAMVAAALGAGPAHSLRPTGHPFQRRVQVGADLAILILADGGCDFAIVDEGPGLSGSSFGSVADWLQSNGVAPARIHFFPSHAGDLGPQASETHRRRWRERPRHVVETEELVFDAPRPEHRLRRWVGDLPGVDVRSWQALSGGAWRSIGRGSAETWPASHRQMEKHKFLAGDGEKRWLVKFAGLADACEAKVKRGKRLSEAGFGPDIIGTCHGFMVETWIEGTPGDRAGLAGPWLIDPLGRYLAFRARHLPAPNGGASLDELCKMAVHNIEEAFGMNKAACVLKRIGNPNGLLWRLHRVDTDNRLHAWEWVVAADGRLVKTDGLDHNMAHDLVGCQDIAWDVAGAAVEFDLATEERDRIAAIVAGEADCDLRADLLAIFEACYLGFQVGLWSDAAAGATGAERLRIERMLARYAGRLDSLIFGWP